MASFIRRAMVYLGLDMNDQDYDDYQHYEEPAPPAGGLGAPRSFGPAPGGSVQGFPAPVEEQAMSPVRALPREDQPATGVMTTRGAVVRQIVPTRGARVHVVAPERFGDAQEIGDRLKIEQPVIVNLQVADRDLARRMIDFCSGVAYALGGAMDKVAEDVFLLTPSNVEVSPEERQRLQERGLYRP